AGCAAQAPGGSLGIHYGELVVPYGKADAASRQRPGGTGTKAGSRPGRPAEEMGLRNPGEKLVNLFRKPCFQQRNMLKYPRITALTEKSGVSCGQERAGG